MIAKRIESRKGGRSNIAKLVRYIVNAQGRLDPRSWVRTVDHILDSNREVNEKGEKVISIRVTNCFTDDPADATLLIQATQKKNTKSKSDKTYHLIFSFPPGEQPPLEILNAIEDDLCTTIGFTDHQRISAVHVDTDHLHVHVAINKVHPTGYQNIEPYYDKKKLMDACKHLEVKYGLEKTSHSLEEDKNDSHGVRKYKKDNLQEMRSNNRINDVLVDRVVFGAKVSTIEAQSGIETLASYVAQHVAPVIREAKDWQAVHDTLAEHGLEIKLRGAGLVIGNNGLSLWVRASQCGREMAMKSMTDRIGLYEPPKRQQQNQSRQVSYVPKPVHQHPKTAYLFEKYQKEKQARFITRKNEMNQINNENTAYLTKLQHWYVQQRTLLKAGGRGITQRAMLMTIRNQSISARSKHRMAIRQKRKQLYKNTTVPNWYNWLIQQAKNGNLDALDVLRSKVEREEKIRDDLLTVKNINKAKSVLLKTLKPTIRRTGAVSYRTADGGIVIDRKNYVQAQKTTAGSAFIALALAAEKFEGQPLIVEGTDQFKRDVAQFAGIHGLNVTFVDLSMEKTRQKAQQSEKMIAPQAKSQNIVKRKKVHISRVMER